MDFCGEWHAYKNEMPGARHTLRVTGACCFPVAGWRAKLVARQGNTGINPLALYLDLVTTRPDGGTAEVLTEVPVEYELTEPVLSYTGVTVTAHDDPATMIDLKVEIVR